MMQRLETVFQVSVLVLMCLASAVFAAAEEHPLVSLTAPVAVMSWLIVDRAGRAGLGPGWSLALGLAAVGAAVSEFLTGGIEARILAPSHLLAYLTWIILFQHKENRHYWTLLGLTVLQVAIASLLTTDPWLGVAVIAYASCSLWTMGVFTLHRAVMRASGGADADPVRERLPRAGARSVRAVFAARQASTVHNSVHLDPAERLVGWHFTGGALVMTVVALALSGLFFMFIPRIWPSQYQLFNDAPIIGARPLTGFTEDVKLGDMGEILENDELVMEVRLFDADSGAPIDPARYAEEFGSDEPLFRGQVMEIYDSAQWQRANPEILQTRRDRRPRPSGDSSEVERSKEQHRLRQRIRLQPIGSAMLFGTGRVLECRPAEGRGGINTDPFSGTFRRHEDAELGQPFEYDAFSSRLQSLRSGTGTEQYKWFCLYVPPELDEPLRKFVNEVIPAGTPMSERAERIRQRLAESEDFTYSLDLAIDDPNVDPVVDFLNNRKRGHCEYYASALALLLRVAGIPSRVVSGFKGGDFNVTAGLFEVRQLHAHLWVEAFDGRFWVPLDPTPGARDDAVAQIQASPTSVLSRMTDAWSTAWSRGVRLSRADQDRMLYEPLREGAIGVWNALRDVRGTTSRLKDMLYGLLSSPERWISWRGGVAVFALLLLVSGATVLGRRLWRLLRRMRGDTGAVRRGAPVVAFYERFRRAAARAGYERAGPQTPREFAQTVGDRIGTGGGQPNLSPPIPQFVTENYYRVRYGDEELPSDLLAALQRQLDDFERQLQQSPGAAPQGAG